MRGSPRSKHECYARTFRHSHQHALVGRFRTDDVGLGGAIDLGHTAVVIAGALVTWEVHQRKTGDLIPADPPVPTQWMPTGQSDHDRFPADVDPPQIARVFEGCQHEGDVNFAASQPIHIRAGRSGVGGDLDPGKPPLVLAHDEIG